MRKLAFFATTCVLVACIPELGPRESFVGRTMVLAVRAEPPESKPGEPVTYEALVASPEGTIVAPRTQWAFCATPKLLTENGAVSPSCLADGVVALGDASANVQAVTPSDACLLFGPETRSADLRPRDPDTTGGFYLPIRVTLAAEDGEARVAFGFERLSCNLANAPADVVREFAARYVANGNPSIASLAAEVGGSPVALDAIPSGASVTLRLSWQPEDAESYVLFDPANQSVVSGRESLRASWFTSAGSFDDDRTGRRRDEPETFTTNTWHAPGNATVTHLWVILRDERGGTSFASYDLVTR
ncbi:hypothetical protein AKJ09_08239 [Labilithrix luteola]|uniref:Lipoprotein n=1 Tax=Labilithrix luteola TaxID=1391654 RepID=A0A0K1Q6W6_9BACT|nr:hypothetical protein [Labilithrix luteola]AKV01576.1 hypothetical protein AKJ09_08239 [Labilithrix luteola]